MMGILAWIADRTGLSRGVVALLAAASLVGLLWAGKALYDRSIVREHEQGQAAKLAPVVRAADSNAADQRAADIERNRNEEAAERAAVSMLPDAGLTDRQRARACGVLRRQGTPDDRLPAACRTAR